MIKRRTLVRLTRFWLAFYIMTWCMTFTMSDVALASSLPDDMDMKIYSLQNASYAEYGGNVLLGFLLHNNGSVSINNVTLALGSTTDEGGGALQFIGTPQVVNNTRFINNTNEPAGGAIYNIQFINNTSTDIAAYNTTFINNTSTDSAVYIEDGNVTINENMFINNTGSYQAIDQDFEEVLGNVTGRNTTLYKHVGRNNITQIVGEEGSIILDLVGGNAFEDNRTVHLLKIDRINSSETAVILFNQTVTARDANNKINNTLHVILPESNVFFPHFAFNQTIWTSDPVTITFDDSRNVTSTTIHNGSPIGSLPVPEKEGCIFDGWYTESGDKVGPQDVFSTPTKLVARWKIIIAFYDDTVTNKTIQSGTPIGPLPIPEKEGCIFDGWYTESGDKVGPQDVFSTPTKLVARWKIIIAFYDDTVTNKTIQSGTPIGPLPIPEKEGYIFDGWYTESGDKVGPEDVFSTSTKLVARWKIIIAFYDDTVTNKTIQSGTPIGSLPIPEKEGYIFDGWYTESGDKVGPEDVFFTPTKLVARWKIIVAFYDDRVQIEKSSVDKGTVIGPFPDREKEGYILDGWYTAPEGGEKASPDTVVNAPMNLYARWVEREKPAEVSLPQTGDQWNVWLYAGIGIVAVIGLVVLILRRRK